MSREWKPGELAMWEHGGRNDGRELVMKTNRGWAAFDGPTSEILFGTVRPLVVIDPEDREAVVRLVIAYGVLQHPENVSRCADSMQAALREFADPKPERPEEPTGLGAVVEDADGKRWVRVGVTIGDMHWRSTEPGDSNCHKFRAIDAVKVLSEGVR